MKVRYKLGLWLAGSLLVLSTMLGLLTLVFLHTFYPDAPKADYPPAQDVATAQQQDLDYFQNYFTLNKAYSPLTLSQAKTLYRERWRTPERFHPLRSRWQFHA